MERNRVGLAQILLILAAITAFSFLAYNIDLFGTGSTEKKLDFFELAMLTAITVTGFAFLAWRRVVDMDEEITRRVKAEQDALFLAYHDHLTGLPNRRHLAHALETTLEILPGAGRAHALFVMDLNGFKRINDTFGHQTGDAVLSLAAKRIAGALRDGDLLARTGGDEFSIVARDVSGTEGAVAIGHRIIGAMAEPIAVGREMHQVGLGIGIALVPNDGPDPHELQRRADVAMYRAKSTGGSSMAFYGREMDQSTRDREAFQRELRHAIAADRVVSFYQPIVDLRSGEVRAFEALARWTHPELGEIKPDRFIPVAEDCGLIGPLTKALFRRACADALAWPSHISLSFNLSPLLLADADLDEWMLAIIKASGLAPERVEIEITENAVVRELEAAKRVLGAIRRAGVRVALDDFGTGSSSLFHLRSLKFDVIKIDRSFIDEMTSHKESAAIVDALIGLGRGLGVAIIAEGVERLAQSERLIEQGCVTGQGFLYGRAISAVETVHMLEKQLVARDPRPSTGGVIEYRKGSAPRTERSTSVPALTR